jgi:hypothetical protein
MDDKTPPGFAQPGSRADGFSKLTGDAFGAGVALVVVPCVALFLGVDRLAANATLGLPVLAIFGIMILFGALALVATLFQRLNLANPNQALALPEGSIRAAIALSLIVLFAIISIMLYRSMSEPYVVKGLTLVERKALIDKASDRMMASIEEPCPKAACVPEDQRFTLHLRPPPAQESTDLAKQLLILVGTLMTSVTSFYFATRGAASLQAQTPPPQAQDKPAPAAATADAGTQDNAEGHADGCNVDITDPTPDEALPAASGGVAR